MATNIRLAIVVSKFNDFITKRLLSACLKELKIHNIGGRHITVVWVPGSFEIPVIALRLAKKKNVDAVIGLGAVIRGQTYHFEVVANEAARGIMQAGLLSGKPIIMGILTVNTVAQAYRRSQDKGANKGRDAATAAIEMVRLLKKI